MDSVTSQGPRQGTTKSLADRLALLFESVRREDGRPHTNDEVAKAVQARVGRSVDRGYISALRNGTRDNPTKQVLEGLAAFFQVPPAYFFDDEHSASIAEQIELAVVLRDENTRALAVQLLRTAAADVPFVAEVVRAVGSRPALREVLVLLLELEGDDLRMAGELLDSVARRRSSSG